MNRIKVGYFLGWSYGYPVILFSGDKDSISKLEQYFIKLSKGNITRVRLDLLDFIEPFHGVEIVAKLANEDIGMKQVDEMRKFEWILSSTQWEKFALLASVLTKTDSGHQYLDIDSESEDILTILSANEYLDRFWEANKEFEEE